ncbi:MAG TPA: phosphotransferase [Bryobacteraceae bacterium]|nr:phosphotransferase [Bryobacteraceae bacterium]
MIPQEKSVAVTHALLEAFGVAELDGISRITKGHTPSLVFRVIVRGTPYLLKIITRTEDPTRHYTSMRAATEAGVAPRVWYTGIPDRISITDFVEAMPMAVSDALVRLPALLRTLHALPPFAYAPFNTTCTFLIDQGPALDGFLQTFRSANILPKSESEEFFARHAQLAAVYPHDDADMVASHNDLFKPDNILFDGHRVWLVDWEAAFRNDRYTDLAVVANQVVTNDEEELAFLERYFGAPPDPYQRARFHLMQQLTHLFYAMAFLHLGAKDKPVDWSGAVPEFCGYHRRIWAGEIDLTDPDVKIVYGRVHWERLLHNVRQPRYNEAREIVADRHRPAPSPQSTQ